MFDWSMHLLNMTSPKPPQIYKSPEMDTVEYVFFKDTSIKFLTGNPIPSTPGWPLNPWIFGFQPWQSHRRRKTRKHRPPSTLHAASSHAMLWVGKPGALWCLEEWWNGDCFTKNGFMMIHGYHKLSLLSLWPVNVNIGSRSFSKNVWAA